MCACMRVCVCVCARAQKKDYVNNSYLFIYIYPIFFWQYGHMQYSEPKFCEFKATAAEAFLESEQVKKKNGKIERKKERKKRKKERLRKKERKKERKKG